MKIYSVNFKAYCGDWRYHRFQATCDTDARFIARMFFREESAKHSCGFTLQDFYGNYIEL